MTGFAIAAILRSRRRAEVNPPDREASLSPLDWPLALESGDRLAIPPES